MTHRQSRLQGAPTPYRRAGQSWERRIGAIPLLLTILLAACQSTPTPLPPTPPTPSTVASPAGPTAAPTATMPISTATPGASLIAPASLTAAASPSATPNGPRELTICLANEPQSLYRYARPEAGREHILAALYDGPINSVGFGFQPVLFDKLPSLANGDAVIRTATVISGETVVDALGRVLPLAPGLRLRGSDGTIITYDGAPAGSGAGLTLPQMVVTFHLRPGLRWSDDAPLTADDSVFAFDVARSPDSFDPMHEAAGRTGSYEAIDPTTIVWTSLPGDLDPLYATHFWPPLPRHQLGGLTPAQIAASDLARRSPLVWGPFMIQEWQPGQRLVVQRNPNFWRAAEGLPRLDRVSYRFVAGPDDLVAGLRDGACDVAPSSAAMDQAAGALQSDAQLAQHAVNLQTVAGPTLEHLDFNLAPSPNYTGTAQLGLFQDARVRQAFAFCLDRQSLARGGQVPGTYLPPSHPLYAAGAAQYPFDPTQGRGLLGQAGWTDANGDGLLHKEGVTLTLTLAGDEGHRPLMQAIQGQLQKNCGIGLRLQLLTQSELAGEWPDGVVFGRRFDLAVFSWRVGALPPCALFTSPEVAGAGNPGGANDSGYSDPAFDVACQQSLFPLELNADAQLQAQAQRLFARDLPVLPLFFGPRYGAARPAVHGYALDATSPSELWNIEEINLSPK